MSAEEICRERAARGQPPQDASLGLTGDPRCQREGGNEPGGLRGADPGPTLEIGDTCLCQSYNSAPLDEQGRRQLQCAFSWSSGAEMHGDQLNIGERLAAQPRKPLARALRRRQSEDGG